MSCHGWSCSCVIPETQFVTPSSLFSSLPFTCRQLLKHQSSPVNYLFVSVVLAPCLSNKTTFNPTETPREKILLRLQFLLPHEQTNDDVRTRTCHLTPNASHVSILFADSVDVQSRWSPATAQPNTPNDCWSDLLTNWNKVTLVESLLAGKGSTRGCLQGC